MADSFGAPDPPRTPDRVSAPAAADPRPSETVTVLVRYFAAARAAAGTAEEKITVPVGSGVGAVLRAARRAHGPELGRVLDRCSFLLDEVAVHDAVAPLRPDPTLDVLPPFAGG